MANTTELVFDPGTAGVPATSVTSALKSTINGRPTWSFDATTQQALCIAEMVMPSGYTGATGSTVVFWISPATTGGSNGVVMGVEFEPLGTGVDTTSDHFNAVTKSGTLVMGTTGQKVQCTINCTGSALTGISAHTPFRLRITRFPGDAGDTYANLAYIWAGEAEDT